MVIDTSTTPRVSVLVTTYNFEDYIAECLDSILSQDVDFPVEILVADDASTDNSYVILESYENRFPETIKITRFTSNRKQNGLPVLSFLYQQARGDYIALCDGDDYWLDSHKLRKQVAFLDKNPGYVLSFHNAALIHKDNQLNDESLIPLKRQKDYTKDELQKFNSWIYLGTMVFRKAFDALPPEFDLIANRDNFLPILLGRYGAAKYQADVGHLARRLPPDGWKNKSELERRRKHLQTRLIITSYYIRIGDHINANRLINGRLYSDIHKVCLSRGNRLNFVKQFIKHFIKAILR